MLVRLAGRVIEMRDQQFLKAKLPMLVMESGRVRLLTFASTKGAGWDCN